MTKVKKDDKIKNMKREELKKLSKDEIIEVLMGIIERQALEIAELKARLGMNSQNSSKSPSSDVYKKPKNQRKASGRKAGGQEGHKGSALKMPHEPDKIVEYKPIECERCENWEKCRLEAKKKEVRHEIDIEIRPVVTAHEQIAVMCPKVQKEIKGELPIGIKGRVQYGKNIETLAVSMNTVGAVSINRTHEILSDVFGVPISTGTIAEMVKNCAEAVSGAVREIKEEVIESAIGYFDETGTRVEGKTYWSHVSSTERATYIQIEEKRGKEGIDKVGVLPYYEGTAMHDCFG